MNFTDLHDKMFQVTSGLLTRDAFFKWLNENIEVTKYLPIVNKYGVIRRFSDKFQEDMEEYMGREDKPGLDFLYLMYDINIMFNVMFKYIDVIVYADQRTLDNYDLVMQSGLYDYIMYNCNSDYKELREKCDRLSGIDDLNIVSTFTEIIGNQLKVEDIREMKELVDGIDKEKLDILKAVEMFNNPLIAGAIETIRKEEAKTAMQSDGDKSGERK